MIRVAGPSATIRDADGEHEARLPSGRGKSRVVAGDHVRVRAVGDEVLIDRVEARSTVLERADGHSRRPRALVANVDLAIVMASIVEPRLRPDIVDRYIVAAIAGGLEAAIGITKTDLPHEPAELEEFCNTYRRIGHDVVVGDARTVEFVGTVRETIGASVAALVGPSGVGKSTLAAALTGVERAVGEVSQKAGTGRHTTSDPRLIELPDGGAVIDTAGVRSFHLPMLDARTVEAGFKEIAATSAECRFRGCNHVGEDGCAVAEAVSSDRLESYRRILEEVGALTRRAPHA